MSVLDFLEDKGACAGGGLIYFASKKSAQIRNQLWKKKHKLSTRVINCLKKLYPDIDLKDVRYKIKCSLPPNWFTSTNNTDAITFGNMIYFKDRDIQKDEDGIALLMHELIHTQQVARLGGEMKFACEYGKAFLAAGNYRNNKMENEAYDFVDANPVPASCIVDKAYFVWWENKDYKGKKHTRWIYSTDHGKKLKMVHNDEMKSIKFYAEPGWKLEIYDSKNCSKSDDWGEIIYPGTAVDCVAVPRIGKQGVNKVTPAGCYKFHYKNGLPGKVSAFRHYGS